MEGRGPQFAPQDITDGLRLGAALVGEWRVLLAGKAIFEIGPGFRHAG